MFFYLGVFKAVAEKRRPLRNRVTLSLSKYGTDYM